MNHSSSKSVIIVDDHKLFREGLTFFLENSLGYEVIAEASNGKEFLSLPNLGEANIILMDMKMPEMGGVEAAERALSDFSYLHIIAITMFKEEAYLRQLVEAGIKGCVFKGDTYSEIGDALDTIQQSGRYFPESIKIE
ncbi:MAG: response regulator transcription factor [Bacteroidetes bacterium]|nr:response regulator transcription factor [Bacteroidota bacterium]